VAAKSIVDVYLAYFDPIYDFGNSGK